MVDYSNAQQTNITGNITGSVTEEITQAPIANALVVIKNVYTESQRSLITQNDGTFFFDNVPGGLYDLRVSLDGYENIADSYYKNFAVEFGLINTVVPPPLRLRKNSPPGLQNLPVSKVSNNLPVRKYPQHREDASRGLSLSSSEIMSLPLTDSRTFDQLAFLAAGVVPPPQSIGTIIGPGIGPGVGTSGQFSANGLRSRGNNFTIDGSDNNDDDIAVRRQGYTALIPQSIETIEQVQITTTLPSAQYGRSLGGHVDAITRSGGSTFRGQMFGFYTDSNLNARNPFDLTETGAPASYELRKCRNGEQFCDQGDQLYVYNPETRIRKPLTARNPVSDEDSLTRGQGGFIISGPLLHRKSSFILSFEQRLQNAVVESNFIVPKISERGFLNSGDRGLRVITDTDETISITPTTSMGDQFFSLVPLPNNPRGPYGDNTHTIILPSDKRGTIGSLRIDQQFKAFNISQEFAVRYNVTDDRTVLPVTGEGLFSTLTSMVRTHNVGLTLSGSLGSKLSHALRISYGRTKLEFTDYKDRQTDFLRPTRLTENGRLVPHLLNATRISNFTTPDKSEPDFINENCETEIVNQQDRCIAGTGPLGQLIISGFSPIGVDVNNFPQERANNVVQVADGFSYRRNKMVFSFGGELRRLQLNSRLDRNFRPQVLFNGSMNISDRFSDPNQGNLALLPTPRKIFLGTDYVAAGAPTGFLQNLSTRPDSRIGLRSWQTNVFVENRINFNGFFTLTFGGRYELNSVPKEVNRRIESTFNSSDVKDFIEAEALKFGESGLKTYLAGRQRIFNSDLNNIAPYVSFALDPFRTGSAVFRGGYGLYYDQIPGIVISQSRNVFPTFLTINSAGILRMNDFENPLTSVNPSSLLAVPGTLNVLNTNKSFGESPAAIMLNLINQAQTAGRGSYPAGPTFVLPDADLNTPYSQQWSLIAEKHLRGNVNVSVAYTGTKGTNLLRFATPNLGIHAIPVIKRLDVVGSELKPYGFIVSPGVNVSEGVNFNRPFPLLGSFTSISSDSSSIYHGLQAEVTRRMAKGFGFTTSYTWSHAIDEVSDIFDLAGARALPQSSFDRRAERASANFDLRHRLVSSFIWSPWYAHRNRFFQGWQFSGIITLQSGQPFTVNSTVDVNLDGNLTDRLNSLTQVKRIDQGPLIYFFPKSVDNQIELLASPGSNGAVGRNTFLAPGVVNFDVAISRYITMTENQLLELRLEIFNVLNRTHYGIPGRELFTPGLGRGVRTILPSRVVQLALRYKF